MWLQYRQMIQHYVMPPLEHTQHFHMGSTKTVFMSADLMPSFKNLWFI